MHCSHNMGHGHHSHQGLSHHSGGHGCGHGSSDHSGGSCCGHHHSHHSEGGCCGHGSYGRRFMSREETIEYLQEYLKQLQSEAKGVEEYIEQLKNEKKPE